MREQI